MFPKIVQIEKTLETGSLKLERWRLVWYDIAIPKQAFILWLVFHHGLSISEKKIKWCGDIFIITYVEFNIGHEMILSSEIERILICP
jgi:hypothetical protein